MMERRIGFWKCQSASADVKWNLWEFLSPIIVARLRHSTSVDNSVAQAWRQFSKLTSDLCTINYGDMRCDEMDDWAKLKKAFPYVTGRWLQRQRGDVARMALINPPRHYNYDTALGAQRTCHRFCLFEQLLLIDKETFPAVSNIADCTFFGKWLTRF